MPPDMAGSSFQQHFHNGPNQVRLMLESALRVNLTTSGEGIFCEGMFFNSKGDAIQSSPDGEAHDVYAVCIVDAHRQEIRACSHTVRTKAYRATQVGHAMGIQLHPGAESFKPISIACRDNEARVLCACCIRDPPLLRIVERIILHLDCPLLM